MELTIEQYAGNLYIPFTLGVTATDAFEQAITCIDKAIAENAQKEVRGRVATAWVRGHLATAWLWLDVAAERLGDPPPNLRDPYGLSRLDYAKGCLINCRRYASLWEYGHKNPVCLTLTWAALGDARESLRGWWEQQP